MSSDDAKAAGRVGSELFYLNRLTNKGERQNALR